MTEDTNIRRELVGSERAVSTQEFLQISEGLLPRVFNIHEKENGSSSNHPQIFHRADVAGSHVQAAVTRVGRSIDVIKEVAPELITLIQEGRTKLFVALHDWKQECGIKDEGTIREQIERRRARNETHTADWGVRFMRSVNDGAGKMIFVYEDTQICRAVLDATITTWDDALGTVVQKQVGVQSPIEVKLAGLADIGSAGEDPEQFIREGNWEFQEVRTGITRAIAQAPSDENGVPILSPEDAEYVRQQIMAWLPDQVRWAEGRKSRQDIEIGYFQDERVIRALKEKVYNKFDQSISKAKERASDLENKSFEELLILIGYLPAKPSPRRTP